MSENQILMNKIHSSKLNPRKNFDEEKLQELADSIKNEGLQQAITVRPSKEFNGDYEIVIGERRFRACKLLNATSIKAVVEGMDDAKARTVMLIENLQREDLSELEEGIMYQELFETLRVPIADIARNIGKSKTYVFERYNIVKKLSPVVKSLIEGGMGIRPTNGENKLDFSIAVKIAELPHREQEVLAKKAVDFGYTKEKVVEVMKQAEDLEATIEKLPEDDFRKTLETQYLSKKFDSTTLPEVQIAILREKGLWIEQPKFNSEVVPLVQKFQTFVEQYKDRCVIIEWNGDAQGNSKALDEFKKQLQEDKLKHLAFIVKI